MTTFDQTLASHGAAPENLVHFDADSLELLPYVMLTTARRTGDEDLKPPGGLLPINAGFRVTAFLDRVEGFPGRLKRGLIVSYRHAGATTFV